MRSEIVRVTDGHQVVFLATHEGHAIRFDGNDVHSMGRQDALYRRNTIGLCEQSFGERQLAEYGIVLSQHPEQVRIGPPTVPEDAENQLRNRRSQ